MDANGGTSRPTPEELAARVRNAMGHPEGVSDEEWAALTELTARAKEAEAAICQIQKANAELVEPDSYEAIEGICRDFLRSTP